MVDGRSSSKTIKTRRTDPSALCYPERHHLHDIAKLSSDAEKSASRRLALATVHGLLRASNIEDQRTIQRKD